MLGDGSFLLKSAQSTISEKLTAKLGSVKLMALNLTLRACDIEKLLKNCLEILKNWTYKLCF